MLNRYRQIDIAPEGGHKNSSIRDSGNYQFTIMPVELTNAPTTFQRALDLNIILLKLNTWLKYMEDFIIFLKDVGEPIQ